jgi:hypothetical protein
MVEVASLLYNAGIAGRVDGAGYPAHSWGVGDDPHRITEMVHGRARASPRQTWREAVNGVG